jgi:hypothetical protein
MKQSAKVITFTGLAGAAAFASATQSYGGITNFVLPTNITGESDTTTDPTTRNGTLRLYYDANTGQSQIGTAGFTGADFEFSLRETVSTGLLDTGMYVFGGGAPAAYYASNGVNYVYNLPKGTTLATGSQNFYQIAGNLSFLSVNYGGTTYGLGVAPGQSEYIGFQFTGTDNLLHDGWLELETVAYTSASNPGGLEFLGGAYNTTPDSAGGSITVGQLAAVPEPGTLAALAAGAAALTGVGLKRRRAARLAAQAA